MVRWLMALIVVAGWSVAERAEAQKPPVPFEVLTHEWYGKFTDRLPAMGHRNWLAIVDSAYPEQTSSGIEVLQTDADHIEVVDAVLKTLAAAKHVRPIVYLDAELKHVPEADAPGIDAFRAELTKTLGDLKVQSLPHGEIIDKLDAAGNKFKVLVLKTTLAKPYTSVFIELDCAYWSADAEQRLREAMRAEAK